VRHVAASCARHLPGGRHPIMLFFVDTANLDEIRRIRALGLLDGGTTNPSLAAKESVNFHKLIGQICALFQGPVSAGVTAVGAGPMFAEARELAAISEHVVVKLPALPEGLNALARCVDA